MNEKISVIIPLLDKGPYIARAVRSVLNQTVQNFNIIVVDGGSQDNGPEIVKNFHDPRIHFFKQSGTGVSNARNEGVNNAKTDFIAFLDADDEWMPKHLETILRLIDKYPDAGMYTTAYKIHTSEGTERWANYQYIPNAPWEGLLPDYFKSGAMGDYPVWTSVVVIARDIFQKMGGFPEGYWWAEDADLFGKIAFKYPVAFSWEFGAIYYWNTENRACDKYNRIGNLDFEDEPFIQTADAALKSQEIPSKLVESLQEYIERRKINWVYRYLYFGEYYKALALLDQCNTRWFIQEKKKLLFQLKYRYPLILFSSDVKTFLLNIFKKISPSFKRKSECQTIQSFIPFKELSDSSGLPRVAIIIVTHHSEIFVRDTLSSVIQLNYPHNLLDLIVIDNDSKDHIEQVVSQFNKENAGIIDTKFIRTVLNYGFGKAVNLATQNASAKAQYLLLLKPDCQLYEDTLNHLVSSALSTVDLGYRLWECRQLPCEQRKYFNPSTLETTWSSDRCCLIERKAFEEIDGFDENIFLPLEDVDLSWRLRIAGYHLMYVPTARVHHASLCKPDANRFSIWNYSLLYGFYLRYKFGSFWDVIRFYKDFLSLFMSLPRNNDTERRILMYVYMKHFLLIPSAILFRIHKKKGLHSIYPLLFDFDFELHHPGTSL